MTDKRDIRIPALSLNHRCHEYLVEHGIGSSNERSIRRPAQSAEKGAGGGLRKGFSDTRFLLPIVRPPNFDGTIIRLLFSYSFCDKGSGSLPEWLDSFPQGPNKLP